MKIQFFFALFFRVSKIKKAVFTSIVCLIFNVTYRIFLKIINKKNSKKKEI